MGALRVLAHPVVAFTLWALNLYAWHLRVLHEGAVRHDDVHALQHVLFLALGMNMWMALLGPLPKPAWFGNAARLVYIIAVRLTAGGARATSSSSAAARSTTSTRRASAHGTSRPAATRSRPAGS